MGKFTNSSYVDEVDSLQTGFKENILDNPFYKFNASTETLVTYYSLDRENSTIDEAAGNIETYIDSKESPLKYRKIEKFVVYGIEKVLLNLDIGEMGLESSEISGEAMIIAGTIIPSSSDYFTINHTDTELMFRVINANPDTLPNGANCYKIEYLLKHLDKGYIEDNLTGEYKFLHNNVGSNYNPIIPSVEYDRLYLLDDIYCTLVKYYKDMYYRDRVESFIIPYKCKNFYDPLLTQFLIDTDILNSTDEYLYLTQQVKLNSRFNLTYDRSMFNSLIEKNKRRVDKVDSFCYGILIDSKVGIFYTRPEEYFCLEYERIDMNPTFLHQIVFDPFDRDLLDKIRDNKLYEDDMKEDKFLHNFLIKYFNDIDISEEDIKELEYIDFKKDDIDLFYYLPCVIYILEQEIYKILDIKKSVFLK